MAILRNELRARFTGDSTDFRRAARDVKKTTAALVKNISAIGLTGVGGGFTALAKQAIDYADEIDEATLKTGVSAEALQGLRFQAEQSKASFDAVERGFANLSRNALTASDGTGEMAEAFQILGIQVKDQNGELKPLIQLWREIAATMSTMTNSTEKAGVAQRLFGRAGRELLPMLSAGAEGLDWFAAEAKRLGLILGDETVKDLAKAKDVIAQVGAQLVVGTGNILGFWTAVAQGDLGPLIQGLKEVAKLAALGPFGAAVKVVHGATVGKTQEKRRTDDLEAERQRYKALRQFKDGSREREAIAKRGQALQDEINKAIAADEAAQAQLGVAFAKRMVAENQIIADLTKAKQKEKDTEFQINMEKLENRKDYLQKLKDSAAQEVAALTGDVEFTGSFVELASSKDMRKRLRRRRRQDTRFQEDFSDLLQGKAKLSDFSKSGRSRLRRLDFLRGRSNQLGGEINRLGAIGEQAGKTKTATDLWGELESIKRNIKELNKKVPDGSGE